MTDFDGGEDEDGDGEEDKIKLSPPWKNAVAELIDSGKYTFGDLIPHKELRALLNLPKPVGKVEVRVIERWQLKLTGQVDALKAHLLENRNMLLDSAPTLGYRILSPGEQTPRVMEQGYKQVAREVVKMHRGVTLIEVGQLTAEQAKENLDARSRVAFLKTEINRSRRLTFKRRLKAD